MNTTQKCDTSIAQMSKTLSGDQENEFSKFERLVHENPQFTKDALIEIREIAAYGDELSEGSDVLEEMFFAYMRSDDFEGHPDKTGFIDIYKALRVMCDSLNFFMSRYHLGAYDCGHEIPE